MQYLKQTNNSFYSSYRNSGSKKNSCIKLKNSKVINKKVTFGRGLDRRTLFEINNCNISKISKELEKQGIKTDFKNNKAIAWCSNKTVSIFNVLNKKYKANLSLPKYIGVEDFANLNVPNKFDYGLCNWYPAYLKNGSDKVYSERTVLFNSFDEVLKLLPKKEHYKFKWENVNKISELLYKDNLSSNDHFLEPFIHEFSHSAQNGHLFESNNPEILLKKLNKILSPDYKQRYSAKVKKVLSYLGKRATFDPLETIADDMTKRITQTLDNVEYLPKKNPFIDCCYKSYQLNKNIINFNNFKDKEKKFRIKVLNYAWNAKKLFNI